MHWPLYDSAGEDGGHTQVRSSKWRGDSKIHFSSLKYTFLDANIQAALVYSTVSIQFKATQKVLLELSQLAVLNCIQLF